MSTFAHQFGYFVQQIVTLQIHDQCLFSQSGRWQVLEAGLSVGSLACMYHFNWYGVLLLLLKIQI